MADRENELLDKERAAIDAAHAQRIHDIEVDYHQKCAPLFREYQKARDDSIMGLEGAADRTDAARAAVEAVDKNYLNALIAENLRYGAEKEKWETAKEDIDKKVDRIETELGVGELVKQAVELAGEALHAVSKGAEHLGHLAESVPGLPLGADIKIVVESLVHFAQAPMEVTNAAFAMAQKQFNETRESLQDFARAGDMDGGGRPVGRADPPVQDKDDPSAPARTDPPLTRDEWLDRNVAALEKTWEENNAHKPMLQREHARNEIDVLIADAYKTRDIEKLQDQHDKQCDKLEAQLATLEKIQKDKIQDAPEDAQKTLTTRLEKAAAEAREALEKKQEREMERLRNSDEPHKFR